MNNHEGNTSVGVSEGQTAIPPPPSSSDDSNDAALSSPGVNDLKKKLWGSSPDGKNPSLNQWQTTTNGAMKTKETVIVNSVTKTPPPTSGTGTTAGTPSSSAASTAHGVNDLKKKLWGSSPDGTNALNQWQAASTSSSKAAPSSPTSAGLKRNSVAKLQQDLWGGGGSDSGDATTPSLQIRHDTSVDDGSEHKEERLLSDDTEKQHYQKELKRLNWWIINGKTLVQRVQNGEYKMARGIRGSGNALLVPDTTQGEDDKRESNPNNENNCFSFLFRDCFK